MTSQSALHEAVRSALVSAGVHAVYGPADDLPTVDGLVGQAAVLWPSPGLHLRSRMNGSSASRGDRVTITCVGATALDALAAADAVEAAIGGMRVSVDGGVLTQTVATLATAEPNSDPRRVSLAVEYAITTKKD